MALVGKKDPKGLALLALFGKKDPKGLALPADALSFEPYAIQEMRFQPQ